MDAGRAEQHIEPPLQISSPSPGVSEPSSYSGLHVPPGAENIRFTLREVIAEGRSRLPKDEILAPFEKLTGQEITLKQFYDVAEAVTQHYHEEGYTFMCACIPPQQIKDGRISILLVDGFISRIISEDLPDDRISREFKNKLIGMRPLHTPTLEEAMLLFNSLPGAQLKATLEPDTQHSEAGAIALRLEYQHQRINAGLSLDNHGSRYAGPWQVTPQVEFHGFTGNFDNTSFTSLLAVPPAESRYFSFQHSEPIDLRTSVSISAGASRSAPGYNLASQEIRSQSKNLGLTVSHQLLRSRAQNLSFAASLEGRNLATDILGTKLYRDRIRNLRLSATFDIVDAWEGANLVSATLSQGFSGLGARKTGSADLSRAQGKSDFTKAEFSASRLQRINDMFGAYVLVSGQYAASPLLASEEFGVGGSSIGRAYNPSEITGDNGIEAGVELRYYGLPEWQNIHAQPFLFYDVGRVWNRDRNGETHSAASAGFGARAQMWDNVSGTVVAAYPIAREPQAPIYAEPNGPRINLSLSYRY